MKQTALKVQEIYDYYDINKEKYNKLKIDITKNICGRICHHGVAVLNILVNILDIKNYLEIGVHNGTSMSYVVNQNKQSINCYGVDLFENTFAHYIKDNISEKQSLKNILANNTSNSKITLINGDSTSQKIINKLNDIKIDLLFIDGNHKIEFVEKDFNNYSKLVNKYGIIVFDDYSKFHPGVIKFVNSINTKDLNKVGLVFNNEMIYQKI